MYIDAEVPEVVLTIYQWKLDSVETPGVWEDTPGCA